MLPQLDMDEVETGGRGGGRAGEAVLLAWQLVRCTTWHGWPTAAGLSVGAGVVEAGVNYFGAKAKNDDVWVGEAG